MQRIMRLTKVSRGAPGAKITDSGDLNPIILRVGGLNLLYNL